MITIGLPPPVCAAAAVVSTPAISRNTSTTGNSNDSPNATIISETSVRYLSAVSSGCRSEPPMSSRNFSAGSSVRSATTPPDDEQHDRRDARTGSRTLLLRVQPRRDEAPQLAQPDRQREHDAAVGRDLQPGDEGVERPGEDELVAACPWVRVVVELDQEADDLGGEEEDDVPATTTATIEIMSRRRSSPRCSMTVMRPSGLVSLLRNGTVRIRRVRRARPAQRSGAASTLGARPPDGGLGVGEPAGRHAFGPSGGVGDGRRSFGGSIGTACCSTVVVDGRRSNSTRRRAARS